MQPGSRNHPRTSVVAAAALAALVATTALATGAHAAAVGTVHDPWEGFNREMYRFNNALDRAIIRPAMRVYLHLPKPIRQGLTNATDNIGEPITFVNNVLQGHPRAAGRTLTRFATNSTIGLAGTINVAGRAGFPREYADFGQTLGRYGVGPGPYLFVPGLGPTTMRDFSSRFVDFYIDPVYWTRYDDALVLQLVRPTISAFDTRAAVDFEFEHLDETSTDPYAVVRSAYLQNRQSFIRGGKVDVDALPNFDEASPPADPPPSAPAPE